MLRKTGRLYHAPLDCVEEIKSSFHNVQPLVSMTVKKEPGLVLDVEERAYLQLEGFTVIGLPQLDL